MRSETLEDRRLLSATPTTTATHSHITGGAAASLALIAEHVHHAPLAGHAVQSSAAHAAKTKKAKLQPAAATPQLVTSSISSPAVMASVVAAPANDAFANAIALTGTSTTATGTTAGATKESGEPNHTSNAGGHSVWYSWTAPSAGTVSIDTFGSGFDTMLATYTGTSVSALTAVLGGSNDDAPNVGQTSKVSFSVVAGTTYRIAIDGFNGASGAYNLHLSLAAPANVPTTTTVTSAVGSLNGAPVRPDHIVVVVYEDRAAHALGDTTDMPYFNTLAQSGLVLSNSHGVGPEDEVAEQDYFALYSGSTQGVHDDGRNYSFTHPTLPSRSSTPAFRSPATPRACPPTVRRRRKPSTPTTRTIIRMATSARITQWPSSPTWGRPRPASPGPTRR